jgi:hypothetical protein
MVPAFQKGSSGEVPDREVPDAPMLLNAGSAWRRMSPERSRNAVAHISREALQSER